MTNRSTIGRMATRAAYQVRRTLSIPRDSPINAFDATEAMGVEVRFIDASSLEGMFSRDPHPVVILPTSAHRPRGRIAFTCAHELGHCVLGHGESVVDLVEVPRGSDDPDEYAADVFASTLLMPRPVIEACLERRGVDSSSIDPIILFGIACELGVGFQSLITQMAYGLRLNDAAWVREMKRVTPKGIRESLVGDAERQVTLIDQGWRAETIDLEVGDTLIAAEHTPLSIESASSTIGRVDGSESINREMWLATAPGVSNAEVNGRNITVRVARRAYVGPQRNRFLPDPESV